MDLSRFGTKFTCFHCGTKFYDLNKPRPMCPKCHSDQNAAPKRAPAPRIVEKEPVVEEAEDVPIDETMEFEDMDVDEFPTMDELQESDDFEIPVSESPRSTDPTF